MEILVKRRVVHELLDELLIFGQVVAIKANGVETHFFALFDGFDGCCFCHIVVRF